jgi:hypothetical protein
LQFGLGGVAPCYHDQPLSKCMQGSKSWMLTSAIASHLLVWPANAKAHSRAHVSHPPPNYHAAQPSHASRGTYQQSVPPVRCMSSVRMDMTDAAASQLASAPPATCLCLSTSLTQRPEAATGGTRPRCGTRPSGAPWRRGVGCPTAAPRTARSSCGGGATPRTGSARTADPACAFRFVHEGSLRTVRVCWR